MKSLSLSFKTANIAQNADDATIQSCATCYFYANSECTSNDGCHYISVEAATRGKARRFRRWIALNVPAALVLVDTGVLTYEDVYFSDYSKRFVFRKYFDAKKFFVSDYFDCGLKELDSDGYLALYLSAPWQDPRTQSRPVGSSFQVNLMPALEILYREFGYNNTTGRAIPPFNIEAMVGISTEGGRKDYRFRTRYLGFALAKFQGQTGHPFPNEATPFIKRPAQIEQMADTWDWSTFKKLQHIIAKDNSDMIVELAVKLVAVFGKRAKDWLNAMAARGINAHDAAYWLPVPSEPGLGEWLFRFTKTSLTELALAVSAWDDRDFPRSGSLKEAIEFVEAERNLALTRELRNEFPDSVRAEIARVAGRYEMDGNQLVEGSRAVAAALLGKVKVDPRLVGSWNYGEYRVEFLAKTDPLAMALGRATNCCQEWGSAGSSCMVAGYNEPRSGFLVAFDGDNKIVGQAWVWLDREGPAIPGAKKPGQRDERVVEHDAANIVLDNIEIPHTNAVSQEILELYTVWAGEYAVKTGLGVKLGTGYAEYSLSSLERADIASRLPFDYHVYSDAGSQVWLAKPNQTATNNGTTKTGIVVSRAVSNTAISQVRELEGQIYPTGLATGLPELGGIDESNYVWYATDTATSGTRPIGYVWAEWDGEDVYIADLAILPQYRRTALRPLLAKLHTELSSHDITTVHAELRENTSYRLLKRHGQQLGFEIVLVSGTETRNGEAFYDCEIAIV